MSCFRGEYGEQPRDAWGLLTYMMFRGEHGRPPRDQWELLRFQANLEVPTPREPPRELSKETYERQARYFSGKDEEE